MLDSRFSDRIRPPHLGIVALDDERFGEAGNRRTHTASGLAGVGRACGIDDVRTITALGDVDRLRADPRAALLGAAAALDY